ncbi:hypothetical protein AGMMS49921_09400 [Endomicrobiia bacterium]|nr:hypothetical protein AGMMS49921_09400 [Endomicrobiia bacterium]
MDQNTQSEKRNAKNCGDKNIQVFEEENRRQIDIFEKYLIAGRNFSQHTLRAYSKDMRDFLSFLQKKRLHTFEAGKRDTREFLEELNKKTLSKATLARKFSSLRTFYKFLIINNLVKKNPLENMSGPKKIKSSIISD